MSRYRRILVYVVGSFTHNLPVFSFMIDSGVAWMRVVCSSWHTRTVSSIWSICSTGETCASCSRWRRGRKFLSASRCRRYCHSSACSTSSCPSHGFAPLDPSLASSIGTLARDRLVIGTCDRAKRRSHLSWCSHATWRIHHFSRIP